MRDGYVRVGCATPKVKVADCSYNADRIVEMAIKASNKDISILVFPELSITGYTCQDMFLHKTLIDSAFESLMSIADDTSELDMVIIVGLPIAQNNKLYDCAAVLCKGEILGIVPKSFIPGYGGTILIAGHNNTFFNGLKNAKAGQEITIRTSYGNYKYKISKTEIKDSLDTSAYDLSADYENLVLYTCYPFDEVGLTSKRLFVYADLTDGIQIEKN